MLAKYVLALLREGAPRGALEAQCREQLEAFLGAGACADLHEGWRHRRRCALRAV